MFQYYGSLLSDYTVILDENAFDAPLFKEKHKWRSRSGLQFVRESSYYFFGSLPYLARKSTILPMTRSKQYNEVYFIDEYEDDYSGNQRKYLNTTTDEYSYHLLPPSCEPTMQQNNVISANYGADLLLQFQRHALENNLKICSLDDVNLIAKDYEALIEKLVGLDSFHVKHNFSLTSEVNEFIIQNKLMAVVTKRTRGQEEDYTYSIDRVLMLPEYKYLFEEYLKELPKEPKVSWVTSIRDERPNITTLPIKTPGVYNPLAYPSVGESLEDFVNGYVNSTSNILLMYSPPGTGKTTLLKHLLEITRESCLITYSEEIKNMDSLFAYFLTSNEKFLIIEDADNYLTARDKDANNHSMKKLLNITDGLTSNPEKKVIFTTNLPNLNQVDTALLRPGRCYKALFFPYLTYDQAVAFLLSENQGKLPELFESKDHNLKDTHSLASLYSYLNGYDPEKIINDGKSGPTFGFTHKQ